MVQWEGRGILKCSISCKPTKWPNWEEGYRLSENCCEQIWEQRMQPGSWEKEKFSWAPNCISINGLAWKKCHLRIDSGTQTVCFDASPGLGREMADSRSAAGWAWDGSFCQRARRLSKINRFASKWCSTCSGGVLNDHSWGNLNIKKKTFIDKMYNI